MWCRPPARVTQPARMEPWQCKVPPNSTGQCATGHGVHMLPTGGPREHTVASLLQLMLIEFVLCFYFPNTASTPCQCCSLVTDQPHHDNDLLTVSSAAAADANPFTHGVVHTQ